MKSRFWPSFAVLVPTFLAVAFFGGSLAGHRPQSSPPLVPELEQEGLGIVPVPAMSKRDCIMNIRQAQMAMRSFQNLNGFRPGGPGLEKNKIIGEGKFLEGKLRCSSGGR